MSAPHGGTMTMDIVRYFVVDRDGRVQTAAPMRDPRNAQRMCRERNSWKERGVLGANPPYTIVEMRGTFTPTPTGADR